MTSLPLVLRKTIGLATCVAVSVAAIGCTKPKQTTAIGTGVGGAVGAGLGAIVGNQTGSTGGGIAIGAVAGAATGALISNAIQEQQEKTRANDEALKRQERLLQSQRNELAELRSMKSDSSYASTGATPRYRYRQPSVSLDSPEVSKRLADLQRRGPNPRSGGSGYIYQPPTPRAAPARSSSRESLARFDVRADLESTETASPAAASKKAPTTTTSKARVEPVVEKSVTEKPVVEKPVVEKSVAVQPQEVEVIPAPATEQVEAPVVAKIAAPNLNSKECKEALAEKELASQAPENSDKLFHLRRALRLCPGSAPLHYELGKVYAAMERTTNAEEEFKQALTIDPAMAAAKTGLAELLKNETRF